MMLGHCGPHDSMAELEGNEGAEIILLGPKVSQQVGLVSQGMSG